MTKIKVVDVPSDLDLDNARSLVEGMLRSMESKYVLAFYYLWDQADAELGDMISEEAYHISGHEEEIDGDN